MKTILLLRHAKSAWDDAGLSDHDRPLNRRGERAAKAIADYLDQHGPRPDLILCSTANRARQTLAPLVKKLGPQAPPLSLEDGLYLAHNDSLLLRLQSLADDIATVLLVGHNDGIWQLADALAAQGPAASIMSMHEKFPTGALAVLEATAGSWRDLAAGSGKLVAFVRPRDLSKR